MASGEESLECPKQKKNPVGDDGEERSFKWQKVVCHKKTAVKAFQKAHVCDLKIRLIMA